MKLHEKILHCRKRAGLSQEALAEKIGVSRQAVSKWETGDAVPEVTKLTALARAFGVTTDWLLSEEEPAGYSASSGDGSADSATAEKQTESTEDRATAYINASAGFVGRTVKRYGWLLGVYIAVVGGMFTFLGTVAKIMISMFFKSTVTETVHTSVIGLDGFVFEDPLVTLEPSVPGFTQEIEMFNPVDVFANIFLFIGLVLLVGGVVLAVYLKKRSK